MRQYHGSGQFDRITADGLIPNAEFKNDFDEFGLLDSLGGTYMTDDVNVASFYAAKAITSEMSLGQDPCMFVIEIDDTLVAADEDKIWGVLQTTFERNGIEFIEDGTEELTTAVAVAFDANRGLLNDIRGELLLDQMGKAELLAGVHGFVQRSFSWHWRSGDAQTEPHIHAINEVCKAARSTVDQRWFHRHFDLSALTCRTFSPIGNESSADGPRIVGSVCLRMSNDGLSVVGIETSGTITEEEARDFHDNFIDRSNDISGVEITEFVFDSGQKTASVG